MPGTPLSSPPTRFAYLGPEGTFAEAALSTVVASTEGARYPQPSVSAALAAVRSGDADAALVPLENSVEGSVPATMDGLADGVALPVEQTAVPLELDQIYESLDTLNVALGPTGANRDSVAIVRKRTAEVTF